MTVPTEERGIAHRRDTGEMGVGRDGRVIDLHMCSLGERAGGVEGVKGVGGVVLRGEDARGKAAVVLGRRRLGRASTGVRWRCRAG
jgi:hypothetical protein